MIIVGIDLSINNIGLVKWEDGLWEFRLISKVGYADVKLKETEKFKRFREVRDHIYSFVKMWNPDLILFEGLSFGSKGNALFELGMINGIVLNFLQEVGYNIDVIPPSKVKKNITGKGNSSKLEVALSVSKKIKLDSDLSSIYRKECEHIYDAISIIYSYLKENSLLNETS